MATPPPSMVAGADPPPAGRRVSPSSEREAERSSAEEIQGRLPWWAHAQLPCPHYSCPMLGGPGFPCPKLAGKGWVR